MEIPVNSRDVYLQTYITRTTNNSISKEEKPGIKLIYNQILGTQNTLSSSATNFGLLSTTQFIEYTNAISDLTTYLATLTIPVLWSDTSSITLLSSRATFESKFYAVTSKQTSLELLINTQTGSTDPTVPPAPSGLTTLGKLAGVLLTWSTISFPTISYVEVWSSTTTTIVDAVLVGRGYGTSFIDKVDSVVPRYYWIRYVTTSNIIGPYNSSSGTLGSVSTDPTYILGVLQGQITTSSMSPELATSIAQIDINSTTISQLATMQGDSVARYSDTVTNMATSDHAISQSITEVSSTLGLNNASVTEISNSIDGLSAENYIRTDVNNFISGYGIHSGPVSSSFTVNASTFAFGFPGQTSKYPFIIGNVNNVATVGINGALVVDGTIRAKSITTTNLAAISADIGSVYAGDLSAVTIHGGDGYPTNSGAWPTGLVNGGFSIGYGGLKMGNYNAGKYFQITAGGDVYAPGFSIVGGIATFYGSLSAATGHFAGYITGGAMSTYSWPAAGTGSNGFYLGPSGLRMGNYNNNKFFEVTYDGNISTPGFNITNGVMTINQINVIGTLNIRDNSVTIPTSIGGTSYPNTIYSRMNGGGSGSVYEIGTVTVNYPIDTDILCIINWNVLAYDDDTNTDAKLYDNGVLLASTAESCRAGWTNSHTFSKKFRLSAGNHTFSLQMGNSATWGAYTIGNWSLTLLGVLK